MSKRRAQHGVLVAGHLLSTHFQTFHIFLTLSLTATNEATCITLCTVHAICMKEKYQTNRRSKRQMLVWAIHKSKTVYASGHPSNYKPAGSQLKYGRTKEPPSPGGTGG
jgi:hypothetical protein